MDDQQVQQEKMCGALTRFLAERAEEIDVVDAAHDEAADVTAAYKKLTGATANPIVQTKDVTQKAEAAEKQLRTALPAVLGPLASVATKSTDIELLAQSTLRVKQIKRLDAQQLYDLTDKMLTLGESQPAATRKRYGLDQVLPILRGYQTDFKPLIGQTQDLIDTRSGDNQTAGELLEATMKQVYELDKVMLVFKVLNPKLYADYREKRYIGRPGGGGKKKDKPQG